MLSFFTKQNYTARLEPDGVTLLVKGGERRLTAALNAGLDWPHDCRVGSCGSCRCILKSGCINSLTDFVYTLALDDIRNGAFQL